MSDIAAFLLRRCAEDEELATAAAEVGVARGYIINQGGDGNGLTYDDAGILLADPARVLAECAAKRKLIAEFTTRNADVDLMLGSAQLRQRQWSGLLLALRILAAVYADHPDFDPAWPTALIA